MTQIRMRAPERERLGPTRAPSVLAPSVLALAALASMGLGACTPTVNLQTKEPIRIQLDVNITQEVRVKLDREVEDLIASNPDLF